MFKSSNFNLLWVVALLSLWLGGLSIVTFLRLSLLGVFFSSFSERWPAYSEIFSRAVNSQLLEVKRSLFQFNIIINRLFVLILASNYLGLLVILPQNFLGKLSISLLILALRMWGFTYLPIISKQKEKLSLFVIGEIKFPPLSLLLSNIEILTHLFRPITLTARLWVNIWVGHLILRGLSFILGAIISRQGPLGLLKSSAMEFSFFLFECLIIFLQTFVFTYLIKVYFEENQHHAELKI